MDSLIGKTLGQYQIISEIGHGGMAVVYKAFQPSLNRYVAIKVLPPQFAHDDEFVRRFKAEAQSAAGLRHPNIVVIHDVGEANGYHYIVMEYLDGVTLKALIEQNGALPEPRALNILTQIASALDYAHARGFVHRDVKPGNIIVGANDVATLTDFGIAKAAEGTKLTKTGTLIGTPEYMSPEQARGEEVDYRTDIYSLGVVAYEMLSGRVPFSAPTAHAVLHKVIYEAPPPLRSINPLVSPQVEQAVTLALAKDPRSRFATAGEFTRAASAVSSEAELATLPASGLPTRHVLAPPKQSKTIWAVLAGVGILTLFGLAVLIGVLTFVLSPKSTNPQTVTKPSTVAQSLTVTPPRVLTSLTSVPTATPRSVTATGPTAPQRRLDPDVSASASGFKNVASVSVTDLATGARNRIFEPQFGSILSAAWSRDGKKVILSEVREGNNYQGVVWMTNDDGSNGVDFFKPGANQSAMDALWSPDGQRIALSYKDERANQCPFLINANGSGLVKLSGCERDDYPRFWSVDGKWLVVWQGRTLLKELAFNRKGRKERQVLRLFSLRSLRSLR